MNQAKKERIMLLSLLAEAILLNLVGFLSKNLLILFAMNALLLASIYPVILLFMKALKFGKYAEAKEPISPSPFSDGKEIGKTVPLLQVQQIGITHVEGFTQEKKPKPIPSPSICNRCKAELPEHPKWCPTCGALAQTEEERACSIPLDDVNGRGPGVICRCGHRDWIWDCKTGKCSQCGTEIAFPLSIAAKTKAHHIAVLRAEYQDDRRAYLALNGLQAQAEADIPLTIRTIYDRQTATLTVQGKHTADDVLDILDSVGFFGDTRATTYPYFQNWPKVEDYAQKLIFGMPRVCACQLPPANRSLTLSNWVEDNKHPAPPLYGCPDAKGLENVQLKKRTEVIRYE